MKNNFDVQYCFGRALGLGIGLFCIAAGVPLRANSLLLAGNINQSIEDGTGPAVNNPGLNNILDGASYTVQLDFTGSIFSAGTHDLTGSHLRFNVASVGVTEDAFSSVSLTVAQSGAFTLFSLFGCLSTGSGCSQGNELALNFMIPFIEIHSANVDAQAIPNLPALGLLEDDGVTDIHGTITKYSSTPPSDVPEPSAFLLFGGALVVLGRKARRLRLANHSR